MNVNKKFDRFRQWGRERMGGEVKTDTSDEFKMLEVEMALRQEGMDRMQQCSSAYIKSLSRRDQGEGKEKTLPIGHFGSVLSSHGDDFEPDSEFGQCLGTLGRANERIARVQETYVANATSSWLESLERSLIMMKEYQRAKAKLESRRLAYDTAQGKMQKSKKEDFRMEEELRSQKAKYEESSEDVYRRMLDIKEAEADSVGDLSSFLDAELAYYDRCREVLLQVKRDWPSTAPTSNNLRSSGATSPVNLPTRRATRSRSNTASSFTDRFSRITEDPPLEPPVRITSSRLPSGQNSPRRELSGFDFASQASTSAPRPTIPRSTSGFEGPTSLGRESSPAPPVMPRLSRVPTEPAAQTSSSAISAARSNLRVTKSREALRSNGNGNGNVNVFDDDKSTNGDAGDYALVQRAPSWSVNGNGYGGGAGAEVVAGARKQAPPPPPPSRSKKPPPPPPPMKRSALSEGVVSQY